MKTLVNQYLGPAGTPQEVKDLRKSSFDLHDEIGTAVVFKHRWNAIDAEKGLARVCPFHDELYGNRDATWDSTCFGTGYVGGYADAQIVFVTIQDAPEAQIKVLPTGVLSMDLHPAMTAPWIPLMGDGDLIVTADFIQGSWAIDDLHERYVLRDVTPVTMRGPGWGRQNGSVIGRQIISQQSQLDKLPIGHPLYEVPLVFDYSSVPVDPTPPFVPDPDPLHIRTEIERTARIHGKDLDTPVTPTPSGTAVSIIRSVRITGTVSDPGSVVTF